MKKLVLSALAVVICLGVSAQTAPDIDDTGALKALIIEKRGFPKRHIASLPMVMQTYGKETDWSKVEAYAREHSWADSAAIKVVHSSGYNVGEKLNEDLGVSVVKGGAFDVNKQYFVAYLLPGMNKYLVPEAEWDAPNTSFENRISPSRVGQAYSTYTDVPENVRSLPAYVGVVDMGTVDFDEILHVSRKDVLQELIDEAPAEKQADMRKIYAQYYPTGMFEITIWWTGKFVNTTPFSGGVSGYGANRVFETTYTELNGKVEKFSTTSNTLDAYKKAVEGL